MSNVPETAPSEWNLGEWEQALTIKVGTAYVCRICDNLVMVTRGGIGILDMVCCGQPMEECTPSCDAEEEG